MTECCGVTKTLSIFRGFPTRFSGRPLVIMDFQSEGLDLTGFKAYFALCGVTKEFDDITSPVDVDFTAEETSTFPLGLNYAEIIVEDLNGHKHPFSTAIPCMVKEFVEGDIELDNFDVTITTEIQENTIVIKFENGGGSGTFKHDELIHRDYDDQHPISAITGLRGELDDISQAISTETDARQQADEALSESIGNEAQARANADIALGNRISAEEQARGLADTALGGRIDDEADSREQADKTLQDNIDQLSEDLSQAIEDETTAREQADTALGVRIDNEISARELADQQLQSDIDTKVEYAMKIIDFRS